MRFEGSLRDGCWIPGSLYDSIQVSFLEKKKIGKFQIMFLGLVKDDDLYTLNLPSGCQSPPELSVNRESLWIFIWHWCQVRGRSNTYLVIYCPLTNMERGEPDFCPAKLNQRKNPKAESFCLSLVQIGRLFENNFLATQKLKLTSTQEFKS